MRIGIDLGGSKIEGIVLAANGDELARRREPTPSGDYPATVRAVADLVDTLAADTGAPDSAPVGVGIPGTVSPATGLVKNANSVCLIGQPLDKDLRASLRRPSRLANDADCFAVSEATDGAGAGHRIVFGVILGTGVGGGLVVDGQPLGGPNAISGEWGHNPLPWTQDSERPGPECYCGQYGCIEAFLSGPGLIHDHETHTGQVSCAPDITDSETLARYEHRLARALASVINIVDPDVIVLGGGLSNIGQLYQNVPVLWQSWIFSDTCVTPLKKNHHGDSSGVRGAAWLWPAASDVGADA